MFKLLEELNTNYGLPDEILKRVIHEISPDDEMLDPGEERHYFDVGFSCVSVLEKGLILASRDKESVSSILDFPCGYGRELRFLKALFPNAEITGGEISEKKLKFVSRVFGAKTFLSRMNFQEIDLNGTFDLVWCGSLFTHLSAVRFKNLLKFFHEHLSKSGLLVFTTHGRYSRHIMGTYGLRWFQQIYMKLKYLIFGFAYTSYLRQFRYGVSLSKPSWILKQIENFDDLKIVAVIERGWDDHQDVVICKKEPVF